MYRFIFFALSLIMLLNDAKGQNVEAQNVYQYSVNLNNPQNDQLQVELETPEIDQKTIRFLMPKIIPGTYRESDYGLFVSDLKAYNKKGKELPVEKLDTNTWKIEKADRMVRLTYWVEDIFDTEKDNQVYMMSGTNIEQGKNFVIHTPGFFGYFEGMKEQPFEVSITKPESFYGSTGLIPVSSTATEDVYQTGDYDRLMDSPLMYNIPDTTFIQVENARVLVSVYSPNKLVTSDFLAARFENLLDATAKYLGGELPVEKYAFILYFAAPGSANPRQGALEHSYSSFYYLPEFPQQQLAPLLIDVAAHEFFHIVTPLTIHSKEIADFDFNVPDLSRHLWLYEGATEYFSDHVQVRHGLIGPVEFLNKLAEKINISQNNYNDTLPFTELSIKAADEYSSQYSNVYEKGALISAMLDIRLLELSGGKMDLQQLMSQLSERYGKDKPFDDGELFKVIAAMTYPEIGEYFERYVAGNERLPYKDYFAKVGIVYEQEPDKELATLGKISFGYNQDQQRLEVVSTDGMNEFGRKLGLRKGDILLSLQGQDIMPAAAQEIFDQYAQNTRAGDTVEVVVGRKSEAGAFEEVTLSAPAILVKSKGKVVLQFSGDPTFEQLKLRDQWLQANPVTARPEDVESIDAVINSLYEVISGPAGERDWERFHSLFTPTAHMSTLSPSQSGQLAYKSMAPEEYQETNAPFFLNSGFWEEEIGREEMRFGELATVISAYQYRLSQESDAEQRGVNSIQLVFDQGRWWIANIIWNAEREGNEIPEELLDE